MPVALSDEITGHYLSRNRTHMNELHPDQASRSLLLTGSLRTIKPKVHVAKDRFDSLHERNMVEVGDKNRSKKKKKPRKKLLHKK